MFESEDGLLPAAYDFLPAVVIRTLPARMCSALTCQEAVTCLAACYLGACGTRHPLEQHVFWTRTVFSRHGL